MKVAFWRAIGKDNRWAAYPSLSELCLRAYGEKKLAGLDWQHCATAEDLIQSDAGVAAISSATPVWPQALAAIEGAKAAGKTVIVGGPHVTVARSLGDKHSTYDCLADCFVLGEGEGGFTEALVCLRDGGALPRFIKMPPLDLEDMPSLPMTSQSGVSSLAGVVSRGCPYRCTFCAASLIWGGARAHTAEAIGSYMRDHVPDGWSLSFYDFMFMHNPHWLREVIAQLKDAGAGTRWRIGNVASRTNLITPEMHEILNQVGLERVGVGMESASPRILSLLKPNCALEDHERAAGLAYEHKRLLCASFIIGTPSETAEDLQATYDFIARWQGKYFMQAGLFVLVPYPGTRWWDYAVEQGIITYPVDWSRFQHCVGQADWSWDTAPYLNENTMPRLGAAEWQQRISALCQQRNPEETNPAGIRGT